MTYNSYYLFLLVCFAIGLYIITVDPNAAEYLLLTLSRIRVNLSRFWFYLKMYPRLRYETFLLKRSMHKVSKKHIKMAEELLQELNKNEQ
jgi:hypothetical protein